MADPPWDRPSSPEACYRGCGGASGSWEGFGRRTPDGAYGTRPAAEASTHSSLLNQVLLKEKYEVNF